MFDLFSLAFSVVMYVLQALGLYTIAKRRGIRHAWLAWVPLGSVWVLGSISDDFKQKIQGKRQSKRTILVILMVALLVLAVATVGLTYNTVLEPVLDVVPLEELTDLYAGMMGDSVSYMYEPVEEAAMDALEEKLDAALTDVALEDMLAVVGLTLVILVVGVVCTVMEYICLYNLFDSCEPKYKALYLVLSLLLNVQPLLVFLCRNKDQGMVPPTRGLPGGYGYWNGQQPPQENPYG